MKLPMVAVAYGHLDTVKYFHEHFGEFNRRKALDVARLNGHLLVANIWWSKFVQGKIKFIYWPSSFEQSIVICHHNGIFIIEQECSRENGNGAASSQQHDDRLRLVQIITFIRCGTFRTSWEKQSIQICVIHRKLRSVVLVH